jgi:rhodanese-related sulfurtransferase
VYNGQGTTDYIAASGLELAVVTNYVTDSAGYEGCRSSSESNEAACAAPLISSPQVFNTLIDSNYYNVIIDVRTQDQWDNGAGRIDSPTTYHLTSLPILDQGLWQGYEGWANMKDCKTCNIAIYDAAGDGRAAEAGAILIQLGFVNVYNAGGIQDYAAAGFPLSSTSDSNVPDCSSCIAPMESASVTAIMMLDTA